MTDLEFKKLKKRQKISFIFLLVLTFLNAFLFLKINIYVSFSLIIVGIGIIYLKELDKRMMKELEFEKDKN